MALPRPCELSWRWPGRWPVRLAARAPSGARVLRPRRSRKGPSEAPNDSYNRKLDILIIKGAEHFSQQTPVLRMTPHVAMYRANRGGQVANNRPDPDTRARALERPLHSQHAAEASTTRTLGPDATAGCSAPPGSRRRDASLFDFNARPTHSPTRRRHRRGRRSEARVVTAAAELAGPMQRSLTAESLPA